MERYDDDSGGGAASESEDEHHARISDSHIEGGGGGVCGVKLCGQECEDGKLDAILAEAAAADVCGLHGCLWHSVCRERERERERER
jgi:hypothetical protein